MKELRTPNLRGKFPSQVTAERTRRVLLRFGDREAAKLLGSDRSTLIRIAAQLPVREATLFMTEAKLPELLKQLGESNAA